MKGFIQKYYSQAITLLLCTALVILPLSVDRQNLPLGWDIPKVHAWAMFVLIMLLILIPLEIIKVKNEKEIKLDWKIIGFALIILTTFLSTFFSDYGRSLGNSSTNPLYLLLQNESYLVSFIGNKYREQGYFLFLLSLVFFYLISKYLKANVKALLLAFSLSGILQLFYSIPQLFRLSEDSPKLVNDGIWIYGTFGQANFYAGFMLIATLSSIALALLLKKKTLKAIFVIAAIANALGLIISFSHWAIFLLVIFTFIFITKSIIQEKKFILAFNLSLILVSILTVPLAILTDKNIESFRQRYDFWEASLDIYTISPFEKTQERPLVHSLFGDGLDTLSYTFRDYGYFTDLVVDRAHNFFLDILASFGIIGLTVFISLLVYIQFNIQKYPQEKLTLMLTILLWAWLVRSLMHTSSIINLIEFGSILTLVLGNLNTAKSSFTLK